MNPRYKSETSTCRDRLAKYCTGNGADVGFGGDPIVPWAICLDRARDHPDRANCGDHPTHLVADHVDLSMWFKPGSLDFVYSSHTLEDFEDTASVLAGWAWVVKRGGHIVLFLPDEQTYRAHCKRTGQPYNEAHVHENFGLGYVKEVAAKLGHFEVVHELFPVPNNPYSFDLVLRVK